MQDYGNKSSDWNLRPIFDPQLRTETIKAIINTIIIQNLQFDSIVCCGVSGLGMVPFIADSLQKNMLVVRKEVDAYFSHTIDTVEGFREQTKHYLIIDDLIDSGKSIERMIGELYKTNPFSLAVGIILYNQRKALAAKSIILDQEGQYYFEFAAKNKKCVKVPIIAFSL